VAGGLSEDPKRSVLLLAAGPYYRTIDEMPEGLLNGNDNSYSPHNWDFMAEADDCTNGMIGFLQGRSVHGVPTSARAAGRYGRSNDPGYTDSTWTVVAAASPRTMPPPFSVSPARAPATCRSPASPRSCSQIS
jgi:GMC oxidoreductase